MKISIKLKKAMILIIAAHVIVAGILAASILLKGKNEKAAMVMGAVFLKEEKNVEEKEDKYQLDKSMNEKYFRPSKLIALNDKKESNEIINQFFDKKPSDIILPKELLKTPQDTVINYFSILREAENLTKDKMGGCGTVGWAKQPYPIAYNFLTTEYKNKVSYNDFLKSFEGIGHINLIKLRNITSELGPLGKIKYFVELETIEGSQKDNTYFAYYYGFITVEEKDKVYKISDMKLYGEDFLCAAYHGWRHNAEAYVDTVYGGWCKLIEKRLPTVQDGYVKNIYVKGTDGKDYRFEFMELTNGTDIEVGQYVKEKDTSWKAIKLDPEKCLKKMNPKVNIKKELSENISKAAAYATIYKIYFMS